MTAHLKNLVHDNDLPWETTDNGVQRKIMRYTDELMLVKVKFEEGAIGYIHQHPHLQMSYIAAGSFEVTIGDETQILAEGDVFFAPSNTPHGVKCLQAGLLVDIFNPKREDFL